MEGGQLWSGIRIVLLWNKGCYSLLQWAIVKMLALITEIISIGSRSNPWVG